LAFLVSQGLHCDWDFTDTLHRGGISLTTRPLMVTSGGLKLVRIWLSGERNAVLRWRCLRMWCWSQTFISPLISSFSAFTDIYNKDKAQFGDLAMSGLKVTELREVDGWQTVLQAHARLVESPNQKKCKLSTFEQ
jgi:hypothetical protein